MPDPNPADHPDNKPELPHGFHIADIGTNHIDAGWRWCISRIGRLPQKTYAFIFEYNKSKTLKEILDLCQLYYPQTSPQPAFHATHLSTPWKKNGNFDPIMMPGTEYVLVFCSVNEAGRSPYFGTFDADSGIIKPVKTKEEAYV